MEVISRAFLTTVATIVSIILGQLNISHCAEIQSISEPKFTQDTTILATSCKGDYDTLISNIVHAFEGRTKIIGTTADKKNWCIADSTAEQSIIQNPKNPFHVTSGEALPKDGWVFKKDINVGHVTIVGPESSWWPAEYPRIPLDGASIQGLIKKIESADKPLEFEISSVGIFGKQFALHLKATDATSEFQNSLITPYITFFKQCMEIKSSDEISEIFNKLDTIAQLDAENKKATAEKVADELWDHISTLEINDRYSAVVKFFNALSQQEISPFTYGFWFKENKHSLSASVISLMKIMQPWKPHMSLMPVFTGNDAQSGTIIDRANQKSILENQEVKADLQKLQQIANDFKGKTITFNVIAISHGILDIVAIPLADDFAQFRTSARGEFRF